MPGRNLSDWVESYLEFTENTESPRSYHEWSAISCISSALQRKSFIRRGLETIYPNNYIILVGPSGRARKGLPITIARSFAESLGISLLAESNTQQSIIIQLKRSTVPYKCNATGLMTFSSAVSALVEELAVLTGFQNGELLACLTNWYDARDKWDYRTKNMGEDEVLGVCFNILAATAPDWLPHILTREAIGGGFTSRCIFIYEADKKRTISDPDKVPINEGLRESLLRDLERIATFNGEFQRTVGAKKLYEHWYETEDKKARRGELPVTDPIFASYSSRRATHILKLSMAYSAARRNSFLIEEEDLSAAIKLLTTAEKNMGHVFTGIGKARYGEESAIVEEFIKTKGRTTKSAVLRAFSRDLDEGGLGVVISTLAGAGKIRAFREPKEDGPTESYYEWLG